MSILYSLCNYGSLHIVNCDKTYLMLKLARLKVNIYFTKMKFIYNSLYLDEKEHTTVKKRLAVPVVRNL
jgi:hypothetical protein